MSLPSKKIRDHFLVADRIRAATFVRHIEIHEALDSTNNRAVALAGDQSIELPALIAARHQTAGRGRGANRWWAADGALTFSLLLHPASLSLNASTWPKLSLTTAVAVCDALRAEAPLANIGIKWPNDVLADGRKVCGILVESPGGAAPTSSRLIIGVGINVNNAWRSMPIQAGTNGASLCDFTHRHHDLQPLLITLLQRLAIRIEQLISSSVSLVSDWQRADLLLDQVVVIENDARRIEGRSAGIASDGALIINTPFGSQRVFSGTVRAA